MLLPLADAQRTWKARHTANIEAKLADARRTLGIAWRYYDQLEQLGGRLIRERISEGEFERFLSRLVPLPDPKPDQTSGGRAVRNAERVREAIRTAYRAAPDLADIRGTRWGALQAVTAYVDHTQPTRQTAPNPRRGPLRAGDRARAAQGPGARTTDRRRDPTVTATLSMVPLAKIKPSNGDNPRSEFADEQMAELVASIKQHGIITPLMLAPDGADGFTIIAGERRYRAAKAAKLRQVPAQVRDADGEALTLAVAENVIRADLSPIEEARAYRRLADEHGGAAKVARLVGKSERLVAERLELLRLPEATQELLAARRLPLACAPPLVRIAEAEPLLADQTAAWLSERPSYAAAFPADPGEFVDDVLRADWAAEDGSQRQPVAYSVSELGSGPILPTTVHDEHAVAAVVAKLGTHAKAVAAALAELPEIEHTSEHDWAARQAEGRRWRECFALTDAGADAARAFGCLLELSGRNSRNHAYVTDPEWLADRLVEKIATHATATAERRRRASDGRTTTAAADDPEKEARRHERQRQYEERVSARVRNLDLGAALATWQPKLDADAVKLLGSIVLHQYGKAAAWAYRLCAEQPETANKQGKVTVRYPRGSEAERKLHAEATEALKRARTPEDRSRSSCACSSLSGSSTPADCPTPTARASSSRRSWPRRPRSTSSPAGSRRPRSSSTAPRRRPSANSASRRGAMSARPTSSGSAKLAAGESVRCECCLCPIESAADAIEKHGALIHSGDCEQQRSSATDQDEDEEAAE